jgi:hypothetical protein
LPKAIGAINAVATARDFRNAQVLEGAFQAAEKTVNCVRRNNHPVFLSDEFPLGVVDRLSLVA